MADASKISGFFPMTLREAYANQVSYCLANGSPITARIVEAIAGQFDQADAGQFISRIRDWQGAPMADAVPLRSAGALHGLYMSGREPALGPIYRGDAADDAAIMGEAVRRHDEYLLPWLDSPPQTNEAGRSSGFVAAMLWLAEQGLPARFECLEIGSSAGINLMIDRYRYALGGVVTGPDDPVMEFAPEWRGPPPPDRAFGILSLKGCDVAPLDLTDPAQALRLKSYIWPEHAVRFERLDAAIAGARQCPPDLVQMNAADFVEHRLAQAQDEGTTRVLMHSIVWQYVPEEERNRVAAAMAAAGERATSSKPLAWISLEGNRTLLNHALTVRFWPGGSDESLLATAHAHGAWIEWRGATV